MHTLSLNIPLTIVQYTIVGIAPQIVDFEQTTPTAANLRCFVLALISRPINHCHARETVRSDGSIQKFTITSSYYLHMNDSCEVYRDTLHFAEPD